MSAEFASSLFAAAGFALGERGFPELAVGLVAEGGRHVDDAHPCVDVRIGRGIRVHVVLAPISVGGSLISVRIPRNEPATLGGLRSSGMISAAEVRFLEAAVARGENVLITGA